jgi:hypothetical protein
MAIITGCRGDLSGERRATRDAHAARLTIVLQAWRLPAVLDGKVDGCNPWEPRHVHALVIAAWGAFAAAAAMIGAVVLHVASQAHVVGEWQASQLFISYEYGFVRRGLPGEVLALLTDRNPGSGAVATTAVVLAFAALLAWSFLGLVVLKRITAGWPRMLAAATLVASPFTVSLAVLDIGRYDAVGLVALAVLVGVSERARPSVVCAVGAACVTVATATAEILFAVVGPIAVLAWWHASRATMPRRAALSAVLIVGPGAVIALASFVLLPTEAVMNQFLADALQVRPDIHQGPYANAVSALAQGVERVGAGIFEMAAATLLVETVLFASCYGAAVWLLWRLAGQPAQSLFEVAAMGFACVALISTVLGIDYRRWWALAFAGVVAVMALLPGSRPPRTDIAQTKTRWVIVALLILSVAAQALSVSPLGLDRRLRAISDSAPVLNATSTGR